MKQHGFPEQQIWFQKEIQELLKQDRVAPPPHDAIVFTGSSIFRFWVTLERDMSPLPVVNRAFGGARTWELLHYMDKLIIPLRPAVIACYCGSNDIEYGSRARDIVQRFLQFGQRMHAAVPHTRIFFVSIITSPQKLEKWPLIGEINDLTEKNCAGDSRLGYVDINPAFLNSQGQPRPELYISDGLHFMPDAYRELTKILKPVLEQAWQNQDIQP